jgi:hypothetical protein
MRTFWIAAAALALSGCGTGNAWENYQETPVVERGACATIIMPGEQVPLGSQPSCPNGYSSIGGAVVYDAKDYKHTTKPAGAARAAVSGPAAVAGAPVAAGAAAAKAMSRDGNESGSSSGSSSSGGQMTPEEEHVAAQRGLMDQMRREIMQKEARGRGQAPPPTAVSAAPAPQGAPSAPRASSASIADELAALRGARASSGAAPEAALGAAIGATNPTASLQMPTRESAPVADRVADRDGDGAPDHWMYRDEHGRPVREQFDENADARPDRTLWLDAVTGAELRSEEDANLDGRVDSWVEYANGTQTRQRRDANHDGAPDSWSYYDAAGKLARQEQDLDGDGYRNREALYRAGKLEKEREDRNGDGRFDLVTLYDEDERIARRDEDRDGDGQIDTRSIYQAGKLVRREVVSEAIDDGDDLSSTEWSGGGH